MNVFDANFCGMASFGADKVSNPQKYSPSKVFLNDPIYILVPRAVTCPGCYAIITLASGIKKLM